MKQSSTEPWSWPPKNYSVTEPVRAYLEQGGSLTPKGREGIIKSCEDALCRRFDQPRAVLLNSGTSALHAAYFAVGLEPGDEVICPVVTFHATASPALHFGAKVVLVDVRPDTACLDPNAALAAITSRTKAIITNAQWGHPVEQEAIRELCDRHHLVWIEDISHAHGAVWNGRQVGTFGDLACASLGAEKMLTGGLGGVLMGTRDDLIDRAILFTHYLFRSKHDIRTPGYEGLARTGYGLKQGIHPLAAVVILDQIENHFDSWLKQRNDSLQRLCDCLSGIPYLSPPTIHANVDSMGAWYGFKPWVNFDLLPITREALVSELRKYGIEVNIPGSPPLNQLPLFQAGKYPVGPWEKASLSAEYPNAERYSSGILSLPTYTGDEDESALRSTIHAFHEVFSRFNP